MLSEGMQKLHDSLSCVSYRGDQHTDILIKEADKKAKLRSVTLKAWSGDWLSIDPDKGRGRKAQMSPLLSVGRAHDHHRACDSVILIRKSDGLQVLYVDLKSDNPVGYSGQFKSMRQFVRYALGLLEEFHGESLDIIDERYIILHSGRRPALLAKTSTVPARVIEPTRSTQPDKPHKKPVADGARLYLKAFAA